VIGKAGIGTPHMDGNTRLCTATSAAALKASFGTDGQPGSYTDVDHCDALALWGHNVAETQTVLWMRMLDWRRGPNPPRMLAVDPRSTAVTREADVHLPIRNGTNGHDLATGAAHTATEYRAKNPAGRAFLHAVRYEPSPEEPTDERPFLLTTGRTVYHFHTRTKTSRAPELDAAAPSVWIEVAGSDAGRLGIREGDLVEVRSDRGTVQAPARISGIRPGVVFVPFHYGNGDADPPSDGDQPASAANELTLMTWDPVSKQPLFKVAAVSLTKVADGDGTPSPAPAIGGSAPIADGTSPAGTRRST
jgi:anaerobic selenocysteine-containing dehydrogenase